MPERGMATRVEAIPGTPFPNGLLSVATVIDPVDIHEMNGVEWQPMSCAEAQATTWCPPDDAEVDPKTFTGPDVSYAPPVAIYYGYKCNPIGQDFADAERYARAGLAIGEPRALERWVMENIFADADDVTPVAGPVSVTAGVSTVEAAMADLYGGRGVLHAPAGLAAFLGQNYQLVADGPRYKTWLGNYVALGVGYQTNLGPDGEPAPDGTAWLYASGPVIIRREGVNVQPTTEDESIDVVFNDRVMLAERAWVVGIECGIVACLVELADCCGGGSSS